jgi:Tfp pilus assembly protein PilZ
MGNDNLKFKSLDPGCIVEMRVLTAEHREQRLISSARRDPRPSAGLVVESYDMFATGTMVVLDITFQDQPFSYRSRGMVSWVVPSSDETKPHKIGVTVFGMQKLDPEGLPIVDPPTHPAEASAAPAEGDLSSMDTVLPEWNPDEGATPSEPSPDVLDTVIPPADSESPPISDDDEPLTEIDAELDTIMPPLESTLPPNAAEWMAETEMPPSPFEEGDTAAGMSSEKGDDEAPWQNAAVGELVSLGSLSLKVANWGRHSVPAPPPEPEPPKEPDVVPPAAPQFVAFSGDLTTVDIDIEVEPDFHLERAMVEAFDRMHGLYKQEDRTAAAAFALGLARDLITCEAGVLLLISTTGYGLIPAASLPETDRPWGAASRRALEGVVGRVIMSGDAVRVDNHNANPDLVFDGRGFPTQNILISPVSHEGYVFGAVELRNSPREAGFTKGEENLLTYIGAALADYIYTSLPDVTSIPPRPPES